MAAGATTKTTKGELSKPQANGAAAKGKGKSPKDQPSDASKPVAAEASSKDDESHKTTFHKPDKAQHEAELEKVKKEIDALTVTLNAVKDKISLTQKDGPGAARRAELRAEQDKLRPLQAANKSNRQRIDEQISAIEEAWRRRGKELQASKSKTPFKTVAEVDNAIKNLEKQVESGTLTIAQEKRALADISSHKRARRTIEGFQAEQDAIDAEKAKVEELRKKKDDPEAKELNLKYKAIAEELDQLKAESDKAYADRSSLMDQRNEIQKELTVLHDKRRELIRVHREANDAYWAKVQADRARKAEKYKALRAAEEEAKKKELIDKIRDEASIPAFESEIEDCQTLIDFFDKLLNGGSAASAAASASLLDRAELANVPKLEIRQVEEKIDKGMVVRKKKGEDDEAYFVGKAKGKKSAGGAKTTPTETTKPANANLNIPLPTLTALLNLSIPPPSSTADIPQTIDNLKTKKTWFEANQKRVTAENVSKAEDKIRALEGNKPQSAKATPDGNGHPPAEESPSTPINGEQQVVEEENPTPAATEDAVEATLP